MSIAPQMIGRYAPSPTGDLHLGNLRTALLAWLQIRLQGGVFKIRMDDLDQPREVAGSAEQSLRDLEALGLDWDGEIVYQSQRTQLYQQAFEKLVDDGLVYECFCSRKDIQQAVSAPHARQGVYPGTCVRLDKQSLHAKRQLKAPANRVRIKNAVISYADGCVGEIHDSLQQSCGDFVVQRADGLFAYQLATAVDDIEQNITDVLRGEDLIDSTARQIYLMQQLQPDLELPKYWHVPLMLDDEGERMAKRYGSTSISQWQSNGSSVESLLGLLAASVGLIDRPSSLSAQELLAQLTLDKWHKSIQNAVSTV